MSAYRAQMIAAASLPSPLLAAAEMHRIQRNADAFARRNGVRPPGRGLMAAALGARRAGRSPTASSPRRRRRWLF